MAAQLLEHPNYKVHRTAPGPVQPGHPGAFPPNPHVLCIPTCPSFCWWAHACTDGCQRGRAFVVAHALFVFAVLSLGPRALCAVPARAAPAPAAPPCCSLSCFWHVLSLCASCLLLPHVPYFPLVFPSLCGPPACCFLSCRLLLHVPHALQASCLLLPCRRALLDEDNAYWGTFENLWDTFGEPLGHLWGIFGRPLGNLWEPVGKLC
eukprot:355570-Chlamydomonas_euryale.AAC.1